MAVCLPFLSQAGYSAKSAPKYRSMMAKFDRLPRLAIDQEGERLALQAQGNSLRSDIIASPRSTR